MRKGEHLYNTEICPISFIPKPVTIQPEVFAHITDRVVPGVLDYYLISNYGRIFHKYRNEFLAVNIDSKGYCYKPLATVNGAKNCRIHRLVMMTFEFVDNCNNLFVNHIDGIKTNNYIWNLEWVTPSENSEHAFRYGLNKGRYSIPEDKIRHACELLQDQSIPINEVAKITEISYSIVSAIASKRAHVDISSEYNIQPRKIANNLSEQEVNMLCLYYERNPKDDNLDNYCAKALEAIGYKDPNHKLVRTAKKIFSKETYSYISDGYNF